MQKSKCPVPAWMSTPQLPPLLGPSFLLCNVENTQWGVAGAFQEGLLEARPHMLSGAP